MDTSRWIVDNGGRTGNGEQQCYQSANVAETQGYLTETVKQDSSCSGFSYTSGAIQMRSYSFTYGTVEVRARLAGGKGPWPAIWLLGADCQPWRVGPNHCQWPQPGSDEIDIAEILNSDHTAVNEQIHASTGSPACSASTSDTSANFHDYTLVWAPGSVTWRIDGQTTCTQTGAVVPSHPMFLIIDTALGGSGGGSIDPSTLPQTTTVDYVRVTPSS